MNTCHNCKTGTLKTPEDNHPSYVVCENCGAMKLTYVPANYQEALHIVPYHMADDGTIKPQVIGIFGGLKIPCPL